MNKRALGGSILVLCMCLAVAWTARIAAQEQPTAIPAAPSNLRYYVNGSLVALEWSVNSNDNTHFIIEAGGTPGTTFFSFSTTALANPGFRTEMIPNFSASAPPGNYYVRVHAANAEGRSAPSNEILVPITGGCQVPGPPTDLFAIVRGAFGMLQWYPGQGGVQSVYVLEARTAPAGPIIAAFQTSTNFFNVNGIPPGTYYVTTRAVNACGSSAPSNQIIVTPGVNSPAHTPNPVAGRLALPYVGDIVQQAANERPDLFFGASCPNPNVRYITNTFLNFVVDRLRTYDQRFGYNSKPTRGPAENGGQPVVAAGDEIAYHYGSDVAEGSANTYAIDIIFSHCGERPEITWRNFTGLEFARWTSAGRF